MSFSITKGKRTERRVFIFVNGAPGALLILSSFSILYMAGKSFEFEVMRTVTLSPTWLSLVFLTAGLGFGLKAGIIPLHIWLPEAHPVAPSNASALMSGVMIKVAVFGFLRVIWDLVGLDQAQGWWGGLVLAAGPVLPWAGCCWPCNSTT